MLMPALYTVQSILYAAHVTNEDVRCSNHCDKVTAHRPSSSITRSFSCGDIETQNYSDFVFLFHWLFLVTIPPIFCLILATELAADGVYADVKIFMSVQNIKCRQCNCLGH